MSEWRRARSESLPKSRTPLVLTARSTHPPIPRDRTISRASRKLRSYLQRKRLGRNRSIPSGLPCLDLCSSLRKLDRANGRDTFKLQQRRCNEQQHLCRVRHVAKQQDGVSAPAFVCRRQYDEYRTLDIIQPAEFEQRAGYVMARIHRRQLKHAQRRGILAC